MKIYTGYRLLVSCFKGADLTDVRDVEDFRDISVSGEIGSFRLYHGPWTINHGLFYPFKIPMFLV